MNAHYDKILEELEGRLQLLTEHAGPSYNYISAPRLPSLTNMRQSLQKRVTTMITGEEDEEEQYKDNLKTIEELEESSDEEDRGLEEGKVGTPKKGIKREKRCEADSIKRDMTDLYRRAKLLSNFAIMNSTGFVKIIKKFEKAFPERVGYFSFVTENGSICDDGHSAAALSDKMVGTSPSLYWQSPFSLLIWSLDS